MTDTERAALRAAAEKGAAAEKATPIGHMYNASYMAKVNPAAVLALLDEVERLREALEVIAWAKDEGKPGPDLRSCIHLARAALSKEPRA